MKRASLVFIIISALVIIGVVVYLAKPRTDEPDNSQLHEPTVPAQPAPEPASVPATLASCVGPLNPQTPLASLVARHEWASSLMARNHLDSALSEFRGIAGLDPGYPAINLDISDTLLKSKHASEASDAIKLQLEISDCLSKLPQPDVLAYCKSEGEALPQGGCIPELDKISQRAHYQAGVVDTEVARGAAPHPTPTIVASAPARLPARAAPPASDPPATSTPSAVQTSTPSALQKSAPVSSVAVESAAPPPPAPVPPPVNIKSTEASDHVGQRAIVCGEVVGKHTAEESNGKPTFVNFDHPFPAPSFTVVIWASDGPAVGEFPAAGNVCVTGTIAMYRGSPEIIVHDAKSWYRSDQ